MNENEYREIWHSLKGYIKGSIEGILEIEKNMNEHTYDHADDHKNDKIAWTHRRRGLYKILKKMDEMENKANELESVYDYK